MANDAKSKPKASAVAQGSGLQGSPARVKALLLHIAVLFVFALAAGAAEKKRLIEFGWDEPDTAFMRKHIFEMEKTPFDGCVYTVNYTTANGVSGSFMKEAWGTRAFTDAELKPALDDLRATPFRKLTCNFLRFNVTPGNVDWFDDFSAILQNARLAARVARAGKSKGILFDIEHYATPLFHYRKQRDSATKSWELYAAQSRLRGREVMTAFQAEFPEVIVFLTFGYSQPWAGSDNGKKSLADVEYGLLAPFLDGMVEVSTRRHNIIEGGEIAYSFRETNKFLRHYKVMKENLLPIVANERKYHSAVSIGFGIWMDYDWRKKGWDARDVAKNFYTPEQFEASVREALNVADDYVWIYTEQARWWTPEGKPTALPDSYAESLQRAREFR